MPLIVCKKVPKGNDLAINLDTSEFPRFTNMLEIHASFWRQIMESADQEEGPFKWLLAKSINHEINSPLLMWDKYIQNTRDTRREQRRDMRRALGALGLSMFFRSCISTGGDQVALDQLGAAEDSIKVGIIIGPGDDVLVPYTEQIGNGPTDPNVEMSRDPNLTPLGNPSDQWFEYSGPESAYIGLYLHRVTKRMPPNHFAVFPYVAS